MAPSAKAWRGPSNPPLAPFTLADATALRTSSIARPYAATRAGSTRTRTAGRSPPCTVTLPTPSIWLSFGCSSVSAASLIRSMGMLSEVSASDRIGASAGFTLA